MSIQVIDKIEPLGKFPVADAKNIDVNGTRLDEMLEGKTEKTYVDEQIASNKTYVDDNFALKEQIPTVPTKTSELINDSGYLTQHQSLAEYAKKSEIPTIPTNVSAFENDKGYLTQHQSLAEYAKKNELPTKTSELINDSGYMTEYTEIDPTVPDWARTPNKPEYTKSEIGLSNVDNTSDLNKPVSIATQTAIDAVSGSVDVLANSKKRIFLSAFFDNSAALNFYTSENLIDYEKIDVDFGSARDASLFEKDGVLYVAYTGGDETYDFWIAKTTDLVNFEKTKVDLGLSKTRNRWAPAIAEINGQIYLTITSRTVSDSYIYMCKFNLENYTFTELKRLTLDNSNVIDSELFTFKNVTYLMVKDETTKKTRLYRTADMETFTFIRTMDEFPAGKNKSEGAFPLVLGDMLFIGVDNYDSPTYSRSLQLGYFYSTVEVEQQGNGYILNTQDYLARHGSTIELKSNSLIIAAETKHITNVGVIKRFQEQELKYYATNGIIEELYVFPNVVYRISGSEQYTIKKLYNPFGAENFQLIFFANSGSAWVEIVNNGFRDINVKVINTELVNEKIVNFGWTKNGFYLTNHYEPPLHGISVLATGTSTITPQTNNEVYVINANGDYTVNVTANNKARDIYVYTNDAIRTGTLTFAGCTIDMSTLPAKCMIHFVKYGTTYFRVM